MERKDIQNVEKTVVELVKERLPRYVKGTSADIQVLTPMRKGPLGIEGLNPLLQKCLNPEAKNKNEIEAYSYIVYLHRLVSRIVARIL